MDWVTSFFAWPGGGVWSNLAASVIWTVPALGWHHRRMKRHITETLGGSGVVEPDQRKTVGS
jgi:hypothetical protein